MQTNDTREIDGNSWTVQAFPATEGLELLGAILRAIGKPAGRAVGEVGTGIDAPLSTKVLGEALGEIAERFQAGQLSGLVKRILRLTMVDGQPVEKQFDIVFQCRYATLFRVVGFALEVNYQVPLSDWLTRAGTDAAPKTETGSDSKT